MNFTSKPLSCLDLNFMMPHQLGIHVFNSFKKKFSQNTLRLSLMAWVLMFICSQTLAANHTHIDSHADEPCVVCLQTQDQPSAGNNAFTSLATGVTFVFCALPPSSWVQTNSPSSYLSRAPPQS